VWLQLSSVVTATTDRTRGSTHTRGSLPVDGASSRADAGRKRMTPHRDVQRSPSPGSGGTGGSRPSARHSGGPARPHSSSATILEGTEPGPGMEEAAGGPAGNGEDEPAPPHPEDFLPGTTFALHDYKDEAGLSVCF
jgi:hypothetical protein